MDRDLRLRDFNSECAALFGFTAADRGRPFADFPTGLAAADLREAIDRAEEIERTIHDPRGNLLSVHIRPMFDGDARDATGATVILVHSGELHRTREYAEAIASTVREPLLALDQSLRIVTANTPFYSTFGLTEDDVIGVPLYEIGGGSWHFPQIRDWLSSGDSFLEGLEVEVHFGTAGRKALALNVRRVPGDGPARLVLIAMEDVSARRNAERALRETQASFTAFTRDAPVGTLETGPGGDCVFINAQACSIMGVDLKKALGKSWTENIHSEDLAPFLARLEQCRQTKEGFSTELRFVHPGAGITWASVVVISPAAADGTFKGYVAALTDITERKNLEDRLVQAQKMEAIGRVAGGIAHDFGNVLTAISSYTAQLLQIIPQGHAARPPAVQIDRVVERAALITRQLLALSRKQVLHAQRVDVSAVLRDTRDFLMRLLGGKVDLSFALSSDTEIVADPGQLQQVILNLTVNARDAMPHGGRIRIATTHASVDSAAAQRQGLAEGEYVVLTVADTGAGMDRQTLAHLFEPFFTTKSEGSGLGLSIVYGIVQQSGGGIDVESQPRKGTTVRVYLPRAPQRGENEPDDAELAGARGHETILLVEDAAIVRALVRNLLQQQGYTVLEASNPEAALEIFDRHASEIALLLTDLTMPKMGGHELAGKLRARRPSLRIILMSAYPAEALRRLRDGGHFLEKPFRPEALLACVRRVLDKRRDQ